MEKSTEMTFEERRKQAMLERENRQQAAAVEVTEKEEVK